MKRLPEDTSSVEEKNQSRKKTNADRRVAFALAFLFPISAAGLYMLIGNPEALSGTQATIAPPSTSERSADDAEQQRIEANVAALAKRLEQDSEDIQGWIMLGRSYTFLERYSEAAKAYAKATALNKDDADLWADYAFALGMASGRRLQGKPAELIAQALKLDPENPKALELAGSAAFEARNYQQAIAYWQKLLEKVPPNSSLAQSISERINQARSLAGG